MENSTTHVALDDSKRRIVAGILRPGAPEPELRELPNDPHHCRRLFERLKREGPVMACYEAGVSGYDLYRQLAALGVPCQVIAPALTPRRPGHRIKTDRRDAAKLVRLFRAGELTAIHVPDEAEEAVRDLVRCRDDVRRDVLRWRHRLLKLLARHGRIYHAGKNWSQRHWTWIRAQRFDLPALARTFEATLFALEQALARQAALDRELAAIAASAPYREPVGWLRCFRGIDTRSAMILLAEIVDFHRVHRPRQLMAYLGLVPSEYSSGDTQRRGALTKAGNPPGARRSRLALPPPAPARAHAHRALSGPAPNHPRGSLAGPTPPAPSLSASRRARQTPAGRRGGTRPRTRRLPLGRDDATIAHPSGRVGEASAR